MTAARPVAWFEEPAPSALDEVREAAAVLFGFGWSPIPVEGAAKKGIPSGVSGWHGRYTTAADLDRRTGRWKWDGNIALRLPPDVVGVDVDAYKGGDVTLGDLEQRYGKLPPTIWTTSRDDGSGIRLFRVPTGTLLRANPGAAVEIIQAHHRYAVCAPSTHPKTGQRYRWWDEQADEEADGPPDPSELPDLPWTWIDGLRTIKAAGCDPARPEACRQFLADHTGEARLGALEGVRRRLADVAPGSSRHDALVEHACWIAREAAAGWYPAERGVDVLRRWWLEVMDDATRRGTDDGDSAEFGAALAWAIGQLATDEGRAQVAAKRAEAGDRPAPPPGVDPVTGEIQRIRKPESWSEAHVAEVLADSLRGRYLWSAKLGWLRWDGRRWRRDENERILEDVRAWVLDLGRQMIGTASADELKAVASYRSAGRISSIATLARRMAGIAVEPDALDNHPGLLNVTNGVVDLRTGELRPHDPSLLLTKLADAEFVPDAHHPDVDGALAALDEPVRDYLGRFFGYSATGEATEDVVVVLDGEGSNGKTTLLMAVRAALGDYARPIARELVLRTGRDEHPTAYAELHRLRLGFVEELPEDGVLRVEVLKALSGGGQVRARYMHKDAWDFTLTHALAIATNHRPRVFTTEHAVWRRLRLIPFPYRYAGPDDDRRPGDRPKDPTLRVRLTRGAEQRRAVLAWLVAGARQWYADDDLATPDAVRSATDAWRASADPLLPFLVEHLVARQDGHVRAGELYNQYRDWAIQEGSHPLGSRRFAEAFAAHPAVQRHGVTRAERAAGRLYLGVDWRGATDPATDWGTL